MQALDLAKPFSRYVFSDFSEECVEALSARVGQRPGVDVLGGDANDPVHLERIAGLLNSQALVIAYLDPARPQDLRWATVEYLATKFGFIDLIINLPVNSLMRAILGHHHGGGSGPGVAGRFLHHANPRELLRVGAGRVNTSETIRAIRDHYDERLIALGFKQPARRTVYFPAESPYYDVLLVSRHDRALELWDKTNPLAEDPQLPLTLLDD